MSQMKIKMNKKKVLAEINRLLNGVFDREEATDADDTSMVLNILKLLRVYEPGNFYGTVSIRMLGVKCRNLRIEEQTLKLYEEFHDYLDNN